MKRNGLTILACTLFAGVMMLGCSKKSAATTAAQPVKVTLGTTSWPTNMFYYLAKEEGLYEKNGANVSITDFSSTTDSTNAFVSGQIDFCTFASPETISPYMQGSDFVIVSMADKSNGCEGLVAKPEIKTVEDLKGKTIATQVFSVDHMFLLTLLNDHGMSADDVKIVDMSIAQAGSAFVAGKCDAACVWDPYFSQAIAAGGTKLYSSADNPDLITDVLCASKKIVTEHPEVVQAVVQSFYDSIAYWNANKDSATAFMAGKLGVDSPEFLSEMNGLIVPTKEEAVKAFTKADNYGYWGYTQNTVRDFLYKLGAISTKDRDCGALIDDQFVRGVK